MAVYGYTLDLTGGATVFVLSGARTREPGATGAGSDREGIPLYPIPFSISVDASSPGNVRLYGAEDAAPPTGVIANGFLLAPGSAMSGLIATPDELWARADDGLDATITVQLGRQLTPAWVSD